MTDMMLKACARLLKGAGFEGTASAIDAGNLGAARDLLPVVESSERDALRTRPCRRNQKEKDTIAAAQALRNLLVQRAA
jgi:hypothetical protein